MGGEVGFKLIDRATAPLTYKEEEDLFRRRLTAVGYEREKITEAILLSNIRFIQFIAMNCRNRYCQPLEDLVDDGALAMLQAMDRFDPYRGIQFKTWSGRQIKTAIIDSILAHILGEKFVTSHKPNRNQIMSKIASLRNFYAFRARESGMTPRLADLMDDAGFTAAEVQLYLYAFSSKRDLNGQLSEDSSLRLEEIVASSCLNPEEEYELKEMRREIGEIAMEFLERPRKVARLSDEGLALKPRRPGKAAVKATREYIHDHHQDGPGRPCLTAHGRRVADAMRLALARRGEG